MMIWWPDSFGSRSKTVYTEEFKKHSKSYRIAESLKLEGTSGSCLVPKPEQLKQVVHNSVQLGVDCKIQAVCMKCRVYMTLKTLHFACCS